MAGNPDRNTNHRGTGSCWANLGIIVTMGGIAAAAIHFAYVDAARSLGAQLAYPVLGLILAGAVASVGAHCLGRLVRGNRLGASHVSHDRTSAGGGWVDLKRALTFKVNGPGASSLLAGYWKTESAADRSADFAHLG